jgi:hypothetical protein
MEVFIMRKNFKMLAATMMAVVMTIAMTACGTEPSTSREDTTTVTTTESSVKEETVTQEPVVEEPVAQETETEEPSTETLALTGPVEFTLVSVGGMYFDETIMNEAKAAGGYDYLFEDVKPLIEGGDVAIGVIQTPINTNEGFDIAGAIANAGFDVINACTTNLADNGENDLNATIGQPHTNGMEVCGVYSEVNPWGKIAYVDVKGVKVAFIAGAEGVVSEEGKYDINTIDEELIISQIEEAKSNGAMVIVVSLNFADNGQTSLEQDKIDLFNHLGSAGANLVLCSGLDRTIIAGGDMDFANGIYGKFVSYQGCFVASTTETAALFRINVRIDETGYVDVLNYTTEGKVIYIDSADHYRLVPVSAGDATNGNYSDDFKTFAESFYRQYNEIN